MFFYRVGSISCSDSYWQKLSKLLISPALEHPYPASNQVSEIFLIYKCSISFFHSFVFFKENISFMSLCSCFQHFCVVVNFSLIFSCSKLNSSVMSVWSFVKSGTYNSIHRSINFSVVCTHFWFCFPYSLGICFDITTKELCHMVTYVPVLSIFSTALFPRYFPSLLPEVKCYFLDPSSIFFQMSIS